MTKLMKPTITDESMSKMIKNAIQSAAEPDVHYLKVVDTRLGNKMIAGGKWRINRNERTAEQLKAILPVPEDNASEAARDFKLYLHRVRKEYMGAKPFCFLNFLVVDPDFQRRGAGRKLVEWGCAKADAAQLPCFLESSEAGFGLYKRLGFETVHVEEFHLSKYDPSLSEVETTRCMIRAVRKPSEIQT